MRGWKSVLVALVVVLAPATAFAQASLSGVVRDSSGAVLPGVTVEASSPVLIEKVRTAVTDSTGRYQIIDLRPGTYQVTFTLAGFTTGRRENVQLTGSAVTTADAELRVGAVEETITVSGATPTVDLQSTTRQTSMDAEIVTAIPTSRNGFAVGVLIPGITLGTGGNASQDVGGSLGPSTFSLVAHGGRLEDQRMAVNGVALSTMIGGGWGGGSVPNATGTQEFAIDTAAVDATFATGGVRMNFIPKDGGNSFSGTIFGSFATEDFASSNLDADLQARGLPSVGNIKQNADFNPGFGGPLRRDDCGSTSPAGINSPICTSRAFTTRTPTTPPSGRWKRTRLDGSSRRAASRSTWAASRGRRAPGTSRVHLRTGESLLLPRRCGARGRPRPVHVSGSGQQSPLPLAALHAGRLELTGQQPAA